MPANAICAITPRGKARSPRASDRRPPPSLPGAPPAGARPRGMGGGPAARLRGAGREGRVLRLSQWPDPGLAQGEASRKGNGAPPSVIGPGLRIEEDLSPRFFQFLDRSCRLARRGSQASIAWCFMQRTLQAYQRLRDV